MKNNREKVDRSVEDLEKRVKGIVDLYRISGYHEKESFINFSRSEINQNGTQNKSAMILTVIRKNRLATSRLPLENHEKWMDKLEELDRLLDKLPPTSLLPALPDKEDNSMEKNSELSLEEASMDEKIAAVEQVINQVEIDEKTAKASGFLNTLVTYYRVRNSSGLDTRDTTGYHHLKLTVNVKDGTGTGSDEKFLREITDTMYFIPEEPAINATMNALAASTASKAVSGDYPVILAPVAARQLFNSVKVIFSGRLMNEERTCLKNMLGKEVFNSQLTLVDDPFLSQTPFNMIIDGEGIMKKPYTLVDRGVPAGVLHDTLTASQAGTSTTGHANYPFMEHGNNDPAALNLTVKDGRSDLEEMMTGIKEGYLVKKFEQLDTVPGTGRITGITSRGVYGIVDGEIEHAVKKYRFEGSVDGLLANIPLIGGMNRNEIVGFPYIKIGSLKIISLS